jgi:Protein tyrosine and serine/threonine kinase
LWEIVARAVPYSDVKDAVEVVANVEKGMRLPKPDISLSPAVYATPDVVDFLFDIMQRCWNADPAERPKFSDLNAEVSRFIDKNGSTATPAGAPERGPAPTKTQANESQAEYGGIDLAGIAVEEYGAMLSGQERQEEYGQIGDLSDYFPLDDLCAEP